MQRPEMIFDVTRDVTAVLTVVQCRSDVTRDVTAVLTVVRCRQFHSQPPPSYPRVAAARCSSSVTYPCAPCTSR